MTPSAYPKLLVQIVGVPRCGTTMLERMIAHGEDCLQCGELANVFRLGLPMPESLREFRNFREKRFHLEAAKLSGAKVVTDSSKERCWIVKSHLRARNVGMECRNVLVWKTPTELAFSRWRRNEVGAGRSHWKSQWLRVHRFLLDSGLPLTTVACKRLQDAPAETLATVCAAIGVRYFPGKEDFWRSRHPQFGGSPTARSTSEDQGIESSNSNYPDEFASLLDEAQTFERDPKVQSMMRKLRDLDVSRMPEDAWQRNPSPAAIAFVYALDPIKRAAEKSRSLRENTCPRGHAT